MAQQVNTASNGKGSSKVITPEQHEAARKAAQARKRKNRSRTPRTTSHTGSNKSRGGFAWQAQDYTTAPMHAASLPKIDVFDVIHSQLAANHESFPYLVTPGTRAHTLASEALHLYPEARGEGTLERHEVAIKMALEALDHEDAGQFTQGVIDRSTRVIKAVLKRTKKAARIASATAA